MLAMQERTSELRSPGVIPWRAKRLERAGFPAPLADALARDPRTDVHALLELVDRGCPPELAARILAPLDRWRRRTHAS
jgi:hypothetical protein